MLFPNSKEGTLFLNIIQTHRRIAVLILVVAVSCLFLFATTNSSEILSHIPLRSFDSEPQTGGDAPLSSSSIDRAKQYAHSGLDAKLTTSPIPRTIWQIFFNYGAAPDDDILIHTSTWLKSNSDCSYNRLSKGGAIDFIHRHYASRSDLIDLYTNLKVPVLAADLLRYMILAAEGGVYADMDVSAEKPIRTWVPKEYRRAATAIVGLEYDRRNDSGRLQGMFMDVQFCQWTMAAGRRHPMLVRAVEEVATNIYALAERQQSSIAELEPTDYDVFNTTGPAIWSRVVFESLSAAAGRPVGPEDVSGLQEPMMFGDILVMPIDAFATNVPHSGAGEHPDQALIRHGFKGSWKGLGDEEQEE